MANHTIYIHVDVEVFFSEEENKGGLINKLLKEHYGVDNETQ